jgi:hypothetical protein
MPCPFRKFHPAWDSRREAPIPALDSRGELRAMIIGPLDLQAAHQDAVSINSLRRAILINVYADCE